MEGDVERYATWLPNVRRTGIVCEKYSIERERERILVGGEEEEIFHEYGMPFFKVRNMCKAI
jgi:hypothetical protein